MVEFSYALVSRNRYYRLAEFCWNTNTLNPHHDDKGRAIKLKTTEQTKIPHWVSHRWPPGVLDPPQLCPLTWPSSYHPWLTPFPFWLTSPPPDPSVIPTMFVTDPLGALIPSPTQPATPHRHPILDTYTCYIFIKQTFILACLNTSLAESKHRPTSCSVDDEVKNEKKRSAWWGRTSRDKDRMKTLNEGVEDLR